MFDVKDFYQDYSVQYMEEGHKHCRAGWIQMPCPFCPGNPGYHLGFSYAGNYYTCWRCGFHSILEVVHTVTGLWWDKAKDLLDEYQTVHSLKYKADRVQKASKVKLPFGCTELLPQHKRYLIKTRKFPAAIIKDWELYATGPVGNYKHRIIAPIYYNKILVSYQGRDFTDKSQLKYKACEQSNEIIDHKNILYGLDYVKGTKCILVEGVTDAWRLGHGAVSCFGIKFKPSQILLLAERFTHVYIMFDDDPQAIKQAEAIGMELDMMGIKTTLCFIKGDPGALTQKEANKYKRQLIG